jgi:hypothetical protein
VVAVANDDTPSGFLSRWSRRKADVREGRPLDEPSGSPVAASLPASVRAEASGLQVAPLEQPLEQVARPLPTMADAQQLTPESDFSGFMTKDVTPDVKNMAMKKLFTDPHFNVMDGMDVYIDDFTQPDPLPMAMLRQMASAKAMNLFDDEPSGSPELLPPDSENATPDA